MDTYNHLHDNFALRANRLFLELMLPQALQGYPIKVAPGLFLYPYENLLFHPGVEMSVVGSEFSVRLPERSSCAVSALSTFLMISSTGASSLLKGLAEASRELFAEGFSRQVVVYLAGAAGAKQVPAEEVPDSFEENLEKFPNALFLVESKDSKTGTDHAFATYGGMEVCGDISFAKEGGYRNRIKRIDAIFQKDGRIA